MNASFKNLALGAALLMGLSGSSQLLAGTINYASTPDASINFNGDGTFTFSAGNNFSVDNAGLVGDLGSLSASTYTIGGIATSGSTSTAMVTGTGTITIDDGSNVFTGDISWVDISQTGTGATLDSFGTVDVSDVSYSGTNASLLAIKNDGGINTLTLQFIPPESLAQLKSTNISTSFSGSIAAAVPDSGSTTLLIGLGVFGVALGVVAQSRKKVSA